MPERGLGDYIEAELKRASYSVRREVPICELLGDHARFDTRRVDLWAQWRGFPPLLVEFKVLNALAGIGQLLAYARALRRLDDELVSVLVCPLPLQPGLIEVAPATGLVLWPCSWSHRGWDCAEPSFLSALMAPVLWQERAEGL